MQDSQINSSSAVESAEPTQDVISKIVATEQQQTKQLLNELILSELKLPSNGPSQFPEWLEFVSSFIKKELAASRQAVAVANAAAKEAATHNSLNNHQNNTDDSNKSGNYNSASTTSNNLNGNGTGDGLASSNSSSEVLLLQNAQLQRSLDEYKSIIADTVSDFKY